MVKTILEIIADLKKESAEKYFSLIQYVKDRAGHDRRYAIDSSKISNELNWKPRKGFKENMRKTVKWYLANQSWMKNIKSRKYKEFNKRP